TLARSAEQNYFDIEAVFLVDPGFLSQPGNPHCRRQRSHSPTDFLERLVLSNTQRREKDSATDRGNDERRARRHQHHEISNSQFSIIHFDSYSLLINPLLSNSPMKLGSTNSSGLRLRISGLDCATYS